MQAIEQADITQAGAPFTDGQTLPQPLQLPGSLVTLISHPSLGLLLQSTHPASHTAIAHDPAPHFAVAWGRLQTVPQPPQLDGSLWVFTSQPVCACLSQSAKPPLQLAIWQPPLVHFELALARLQAVAQLPQ